MNEINSNESFNSLLAITTWKINKLLHFLALYLFVVHDLTKRIGWKIIML